MNSEGGQGEPPPLSVEAMCVPPSVWNVNEPVRKPPSAYKCAKPVHMPPPTRFDLSNSRRSRKRPTSLIVLSDDDDHHAAPEAPP